MIFRKMSEADPYNYPIGKSRLEPVGVLIFAVIMSFVSLQIFTEGLTKVNIYYICSTHIFIVLFQLLLYIYVSLSI